jgi:two-component system, NarL family, invasion response regulator UvrY
MPRILVADSQPVFRRGLRQVFADTPDLQVVAEAGSEEQVLFRLTNAEYDLIVLDIDLSATDGIQLLAEVKRIRPYLRVFILSREPEQQYALRCLRAGASGYLGKESDPEEILTAVRKILEGGTYVSPALAQQLLASLVQKERASLPHHALSAREDQIMRLLGSGTTVSQIARDLCLSVKTVSTHRARILSKLNMQSNADLIRYTAQHGLID